MDLNSFNKNDMQSILASMGIEDTENMSLEELQRLIQSLQQDESMPPVAPSMSYGSLNTDSVAAEDISFAIPQHADGPAMVMDSAGPNEAAREGMLTEFCSITGAELDVARNVLEVVFDCLVLIQVLSGVVDE
jgi:hypothetical protein